MRTARFRWSAKINTAIVVEVNVHDDGEVEITSVDVAPVQSVSAEDVYHALDADDGEWGRFDHEARKRAKWQAE